MSDRPCNLCDYRQRQRIAKSAHQKLRLVPDGGWLRVQVAEIGTKNWKDGECLYLEVPASCQC